MLEYRDVLGYEGKYQVDNSGNVYSLSYYGNKDKKHELKQHVTKGYKFVCFHYNKKFKNKYVHRLVWEAFNGPIPDSMQINHLNENKLDNRLENLSIATPKENANYGTRNERFALAQRNRKIDSKPVLQYDKKGNFIKKFSSISEAGRLFKKRASAECCISRCCRGKCKTALGYKWRFKNPDD